MRACVDPVRLRYYRSHLRAWFLAHGRDLPWRRTRDPYRILVSEIMLHQTQVPRVAEVYAEFLKRFPTIDDVAGADLADVKAVTDPLGYKVRGRWIKQIADEVVTYRAGVMPDSVDELMRLPGVGRYTAGAVMSFAHEAPAPILDTNVARVLGRWFGGTIPLRDPDGRRERRLWALADAMVPRARTRAPRPARSRTRRPPPAAVWVINQALLDFGAQICTARAPRCDACPVRRRCHYVQADGGRRERRVVAWVEADGRRAR